MHRSIRSLALPAVALALLTTACSDDDDPTTTTAAEQSTTTAAPGTTMDPSYGATSTTDAASSLVGIMEASDQTGDGTVLIVDSVSLQGGSGHIALHIDVDGTPGAVVGNIAVPEGITEDLEVPFDEPAVTGTYWPMVHIDDGDGEYKFPGPDVPLKVGDDPVMTAVELTVE